MTNITNFFDNANQNTTTDLKNEVANPINNQAEKPDVSAFEALGLSKILLKSIAKTGYTTPTPIQAQSIPLAINGRDLLLSAQTGSGKTAAFVLPILQMLSQEPVQKSKSRQPKKVKALILTPTRELANQVSDSIRRYGTGMRDVFSVPLVGGSAYSGQIRALKKGVQIIIATPGRLLDHINAGRVDLSELSILVLDEADRMLDMGFAEDIEAILQATPEARQTIMSSATWDGEVGKIAETFTKNPERVSIKVETAHIDEKVYFCDNFDHKNKLLEHLICDQDRQQAIIFTATKRSTEELAERLETWGHKVCYLHGDLPQGKRNRIVSDLRSGRYQLVVATDVAARGIDLPNISHVFNYDLPRQVEDYVHRIGRSGRAGRTGIAINLCSRDDRRQFGNINRYLKREMVEAVVEGLEPKFVEKPKNPRKRFDDKGGKSARFGRSERFEKKPRFYGEKFDKKEGFDKPKSERFEKRAKPADDRFDDVKFDKKSDKFGEKSEKRFGSKFDKGFNKDFKRERGEQGKTFEKKSRFGKDEFAHFDEKKARKPRFDKANDKFDKPLKKSPKNKGMVEELYKSSAPRRAF